MKFIRQYQLSIQADPTSSEMIVIESPYTLEFSISHSIASGANTGLFVLYNMKPDTRKRIYQDKFVLDEYRQIVFKAGYRGEQLSVAFQGNTREAYSQRQGTEWRTTIDAFDGGFSMSNGDISLTLPANTSKQYALEQILKSMPKSGAPTLSQFPGTYSGGLSLSGRPWDVLQGLIDTKTENAFIENEKPFILGLDDCIAGPAMVLNAATGLMGTPKRMGTMIEARMVFEPRMRLGQQVQLDSRETVNNGNYKVLGYTHNGVISDAICGDAITTAQLYVGTKRLKQVGS